MKAEAETGVMQLQAKECCEFLVVSKSWKIGMEDYVKFSEETHLFQASEETNSVDTLILDFGPSAQ